MFLSFEESGEPNNDELAFYSFSGYSLIVLSITAADAQAISQEVVSFLNKLMHELALPGDSKYCENSLWRKIPETVKWKRLTKILRLRYNLTPKNLRVMETSLNCFTIVSELL